MYFKANVLSLKALRKTRGKTKRDFPCTMMQKIKVSDWASNSFNVQTQGNTGGKQNLTKIQK